MLVIRGREECDFLRVDRGDQDNVALKEDKHREEMDDEGGKQNEEQNHMRKRS